MNIMMVHLRNIGGIAGGLEKVVCQFSNEMVSRGHAVTIVIYDDSGQPPYYALDKKVNLVNIRERRSEPHRIGFIRKMGREWARSRGRVESWYEDYRDPYILPSLQEVYQKFHPDVILNQYYTSSGFIYASHPSCPVINMFHSEPNRIFPNASPRELQGIKHSAFIQVLLPSFMQYVKKSVPETPCICIPNIVHPAKKTAELALKKEQYTLLAVGRLDKKHKQQHLLIEAFAMAASKYPNWKVELWGDGNEAYKKELQRLIKEKNLSDRVYLRGATHDVLNKYISSDLFVFPSASEGFGLALTEAMSAGLPVIGYKSCQACSDIIRDGETGLLADDGAKGLWEKMDILMGNQNMRVEMGHRARTDMEQYAPEKVWNRWEQVLKSVVSEHPVV